MCIQAIDWDGSAEFALVYWKMTCVVLHAMHEIERMSSQPTDGIECPFGKFFICTHVF